MAQTNLEEFKVNTRLKLSALWTAVMFCYIYGDYFELYVPHKVEGLLNGDNGLDHPLKLFAASVMLAIPAVMIFLSLMLKPKTCRLLNIIWGTFFTLLMLLIASFSFSPWLAFYVFLAIVESIITSVIVWQAWHWQRKEI